MAMKVLEVFENGLAAKQGLEIGDLIFTVEGQEFTDNTQFQEIRKDAEDNQLARIFRRNRFIDVSLPKGVLGLSLKGVNLEYEAQYAEYCKKENEALREKSLPVIEIAKIAREVSAHADIPTVLDHAELLITSNEFRKAVEESNEALKPQYEEAVFQKMGVSESDDVSDRFRHFLDTEITRCIEMGLNQLFLDERLRPYLGNSDQQEQQGRKIEKGKGWEDLKDQL